MKKGGREYRQVWKDFRGEGGIYATGLIPPLPTGRPNNTCGFVFKEIRYHRKREKRKKEISPPFLHRIMCCGKTTVVENAPIVFSFSPLALLPERRVRLWDNNGCIRTATFFPYTHTNCCNMDGHGVRSIYAPNQTYRH